MEFRERVKGYEARFKEDCFDYYEGATIVSKLIYKDKLIDRYYQILEEFKNLKSEIYSDKHLCNLFRAKKDKRILAINIMRSRTFGLLAITDAIARFNLNKNMTKDQIEAYRKLQMLRCEILKFAEGELNYSNILANQKHYETYEKGV